MKKYEVKLEDCKAVLVVEAKSHEGAIKKAQEIMLKQLPKELCVVPNEGMKLTTKCLDD